MKRLRSKRVSRSIGGNVAIFVMLSLFGLFFLFPLVYLIVNAFKPLNELFIYPPQFYVENPTMENFRLMFRLVGIMRVPFERYLFNSLFITAAGTVLYIFVASLAAYPLAKHQFGGRLLFVNLVVWAMLFRPEILQVPQYLIIVRLGWLNDYLSVIIPALASSMGVFLMRQFIVAMVPNALLEAAKIDGCSEWGMLFRPAHGEAGLDDADALHLSEPLEQYGLPVHLRRGDEGASRGAVPAGGGRYRPCGRGFGGGAVFADTHAGGICRQPAFGHRNHVPFGPEMISATGGALR